MVNPDYQLRPGETVDQYNARLAAAKLPNALATPVDTTPDIIKSAAGAGVGVGDLPKLITTSPDENQRIKDDLAKQYGYDSFDAFTQSVFQKPSKTTEQFYNDSYNAAGLPDLLTKLTTSKNNLNTATGNINENPWLDEASRVGRSSRLQQLANGEIGNLQDEYNLRLNQVHDLVTRHSEDLANNQTVNEARLNFLLKQAEEKAQQQQASTLSKYLPDYFKNFKDSKGPTTVTVPGTSSFYQWDDASNSFKFVGGTTPESGAGSVAENNNPGNIKLPAGGIEEARIRYNDPGAQIGSAATDGGNFIKFSDSGKGEAAIPILLKSGYGNLTVEQAYKKWSNGGYGAEVIKGQGVDPKAFIRDLPPDQLDTFISGLHIGEGTANSDTAALAQQLVAGTLAPSQLAKRTTNYNKVLVQANQLSMAQKGVPFDAITAEQQFAFGKSEKTQLIISSARTALQTIDRAVTASNNVDRTQLSFLNNLIIGTKKATSDPKTAAFITDINSLGDEIGTVLGQGSSTDFKTQLGLLIADKHLSKEAFAAAMAELTHLFKNKINTTLDQAGKGNLSLGDSLGDVESIKSQYGLNY